MWLNVCSNCFLGSGFILQWKGVHFSDGSLFLVRGTCFNGSFKKIHEAEWVGAAPHAPLHYGKPRGYSRCMARIHFNWFNRIQLKLILLTLLFKSSFFKTNLNCCYILLLDIFNHYAMGFFKYALSRKLKNDIFNKSAFGNKTLVIKLVINNYYLVL